MPLLQGLQDFLELPGVDRHRVKLTMLGDCHRWRDVDLFAWCAERGLGDVVSFEAVGSVTTVRELTRNSDVLVNFAQRQKAQIPAKIFEQIASRRPVFLFAEPDSESALCVRELPQFVRLDDDRTVVCKALCDVYDKFVVGARVDFADVSDIQRFSMLDSNRRLVEAIQRVVEAPACSRRTADT
jgi:hypothetical protein